MILTLAIIKHMEMQFNWGSTLSRFIIKSNRESVDKTHIWPTTQYKEKRDKQENEGVSWESMDGMVAFIKYHISEGQMLLAFLGIEL